MFEVIKKFFRKRKIRKHASKVETTFLPLEQISTASFVIDVQETLFDLLKEDILTWCRKKGIKANIYFFDFRKLNKGEQLMTSIDKTFLRKELNWIGCPTHEKVMPMLQEECDLFVSMVDNGEFPIDFISRCIPARFKVGRFDYPGNEFNMIFSGNGNEDLKFDSRQIFAGLTDFLEKIR